MPTVSVFFGITIKLFYNDHAPPHFHAEYGDEEALLDIETVEVLAGHLPPRVLRLVSRWAVEHQGELRQAWKSARAEQPLPQIAPLV